MLKQEFQYYISHQEELVEKYNGKFLVIKGESIVGAYDSHSEAYQEATKEMEIGTFLIQHCLAGEDGYTQTFHSRAIFYKSV
jgi:hypothetical protein